MTVLLSSRSLVRGLFLITHHNDGQKNSYQPCIITHSESSLYPTEYEEASTVESSGDECYDSIEQQRANLDDGRLDDNTLPPLIDDCSELDHSRRIDIAKSHGFDYDEDKGVQSILDALTPHERKHMSDDSMPLRHYRADKGNLPDSIRKIKATIQWRQDFNVEDIKRCFCDRNNPNLPIAKQKELNHLAEVIAKENETGKIYVRGYDKQGRAVLYLTPGRENSRCEIDNMRHLVYHLERAIACTRRKSGRQKVCIVIGYQGFKIENAPPLSVVRHTLQILQGHYPERMFRAYICDPPLVFRMFWNLIKHFIDPATLDKIAFCTGKEGKALLERDFDTNTTEKQAGGKKPLRKFCSREFLFDTPHHCTFDE
ncbi:hypothetical protein ACHAXM_006569 [Skeletonema potamos]